MGGRDKGLLELRGRPMVEHVMERLRPQVGGLIISANRNLDHYAAYGWPVIPDPGGDFAGPLAGIAALLARAETPLVLVVPCDGPGLPLDLAARLSHALEGGGPERFAAATAHDGERPQPLFALLRRELAGSIEAFLARGERRLQSWLAEQAIAQADFSDCPQAFANVNSETERIILERGLRTAS